MKHVCSVLHGIFLHISMVPLWPWLLICFHHQIYYYHWNQSSPNWLSLFSSGWYLDNVIWLHSFSFKCQKQFLTYYSNNKTWMWNFIHVMQWPFICRSFLSEVIAPRVKTMMKLSPFAVGAHAPSKPHVQVLGRNELHIAWDSPEVPLGRITRYDVLMNNKVVYSGTELSYTVRRLVPDTEYSFVVSILEHMTI